MSGGRKPEACLLEEGCQSASSVSLIQGSHSFAENRIKEKIQQVDLIINFQDNKGRAELTLPLLFISIANPHQTIPAPCEAK